MEGNKMFAWIILMSCMLLVSSIYFIRIKRKQRMMKQRNHALCNATDQLKAEHTKYSIYTVWTKQLSGLYFLLKMA